MGPRKLTNRELDELGKRLVIAGKRGDGEIERIVSNPMLYDGVLAKIAADRPVRQKRLRFAWKPAAAMAMTVAFLSIPLLAYLKFSQGGDQTARRPSVPFAAPEKPSVTHVEPPEPPDIEQSKPFQATVRTKPAETAPASRSRKARASRSVEAEPAVFHPIGLAERAEDAAIDGRVVRVEMPRGALFAMGVDIPLENGSRSIQADLLVGADGSPRAIRLVE
jgi:hypothetical protein